MRVLLDTNVLARSARVTDPDHSVAAGAIAHLRASGNELVIVPQSLYEFWVVSTRPASQNGWGLSVAEAVTEVSDFRRLFPLLADTPAVFDEWYRLVVSYSVIGKQGHDARFVAAMLVHGVTYILTFNVGHFQRFPGITVLDPATVAAPGP